MALAQRAFADATSRARPAALILGLDLTAEAAAGLAACKPFFRLAQYAFNFAERAALAAAENLLVGFVALAAVATGAGFGSPIIWPSLSWSAVICSMRSAA